MHENIIIIVRATSLYMPGARIKQLFGILIIIVTLYKIYTLFG
jgi:uncharacterized protein